MKAHSLLAGCATVAIAFSLLTPGRASAKDWELRMSSTSNACHVQTSKSMPKLGNLLSDHDTRKAACDDGKSRHDPDMSNTSKCWTYTKGTIDGCKLDGVVLPKAVKKGKKKQAASPAKPASR